MEDLGGGFIIQTNSPFPTRLFPLKMPQILIPVVFTAEVSEVTKGV